MLSTARLRNASPFQTGSTTETRGRNSDTIACNDLNKCNAWIQNPRTLLLLASRSRSRLRRPVLREIVRDGSLHDRLERRFIELLVPRDIDRPRLAQELRVEELLRVRKARARGEREPHPLLEDDPDTDHPVVRPDGRAQWVAGALPLHILRRRGVRVVDELAELTQHRAAPIGR